MSALTRLTRLPAPVSAFTLAALFTLLLLQPPTAAAQQATAFDRQKMNTYLQTLADEQKVMGALAIDSAGTEVYRRSLGIIRRTAGDPVQAGEQTAYRIGSITKTFTATMIMQLIEEGALALDTPLADYYPDIPNAERITIAHLLGHRSGLYNFTNAPDYPQWMTEKRSRARMLQLFREQEPQFEPGSRTSYSNTNYVLLGYIIEQITGTSYAKQLQQRIVKPLELEHTYYGDGIDPEKGEAASFRFVEGQWKRLPETDMSIPGGAGGIVSTPRDLTDFIRALFEGELLAPASLEKMTTMQGGLGLGLMKIPFHDTYAYGHNGGIDGFQSHLSYFPDREVALAFTGNGLNYSMNNVLIGVLNIYFGKPFEIPTFDTPAVALSSAQMQRFTGSYSSAQLPMDIEVFIKGETLMGRATGQPSFPLTATDSATVRFQQAGLVMTFDSLKDGKYRQFTLEQGGGRFLFERED